MIQYTPDRSTTRQQGFAEQASALPDQMRECVEDYPKGAVLLGFGLGFGAGLALASLLCSSTDYFSREESFAERISHKVADSLGDVLPKSWKNRLQS